MSHSEELDRARRQIRALLNLGNDNGATDAEAQNALRFARRLMLRHTLSEAELVERPREPHEIAAETEYAQAEHATTTRHCSTWEKRLASAIDHLLGSVKHYHDHARAVRTTRGTLLFDDAGAPRVASRLVWYGPADDVAMAVGLMDEWTATIAGMARLRFGGALRGPGRSYAEGFAMALSEKARAILQGEARELEAHRAGELDQAQAASALVLVRATSIMEAHRARAPQWLREVHGIRLSAASGGRRGWHHEDAHSAGRADGARANFARPEARRRLGQ